MFNVEVNMVMNSTKKVYRGIPIEIKKMSSPTYGYGFGHFNVEEYHCGYINISHHPKLVKHFENLEEITYNDSQYHIIGFDTMYLYNLEHPVTQTYEYVHNRLKTIIDLYYEE